jgi:hypothetical protein
MEARLFYFALYGVFSMFFRKILLQYLDKIENILKKSIFEVSL